MQEYIVVKGARAHNLKNIDITIPRNQLVIFTGLSGSGKSTLVFDTIYAEGQRRYVESLSSYARQFLGLMEKPDVDRIEGLSPAISIDQKTGTHNPRSTVGTVTEIYDYLRLLFARIGTPYCPNCHNKEIKRQSVQDIVDHVAKLPKGTKCILLAPMIRDRKGVHDVILKTIKKKGFVRVRVDKELYDINEVPDLDKNKKHSIEVVVDRLVMDDSVTPIRLSDSVEAALRLSEGIIYVLIPADGGIKKSDQLLVFSEHFACDTCGFSFVEIEPRNFSFNSPHGACPKCTGLGNQQVVDADLVIPNPRLTLAEGAIIPWSRTDTSYSWYGKMLRSVAEKYGFSLNVPVSELTAEQRQIILYGDPEQQYLTANLPGDQEEVGKEYDFVYEGVIPNLERRHKETTSDYVRTEIEKFMRTRPCPECKGRRLKKEMLYVKIEGKHIADVSDLSVADAQVWFSRLVTKLISSHQTIATPIVKEIQTRLNFLAQVGLSYLTLSRSAQSLSGGESQRIRLATQIGSNLVGVLYVLDEPSIGLHPRDNTRLIETLRELQKIGNSVLVVEHDSDMMKHADYIFDLGPGAGEHGGSVVFQGTYDEILTAEGTLTGDYLSGRKSIPVPAKRRPVGVYKEDDKKLGWLVIKGASQNNLKDLDVPIPLQRFVCVTGVSGSGKSSLINEILYPVLAQKFYRSKLDIGEHKEITGTKNLDKVIDIDQSPIGRTPRSNPATYTGVFNYIRKVFCGLPEAKIRGYKEGRFSFNVKGGRCENCQGDGEIKIEMHFLPDVYVKCDVCHGKRYNREVLDIKYKGKTIADVLDMTVEEALEFFKNIPNIHRRLQTLDDVGLSYVKLGQSAPTLSGGEAQRVKLATELSKRATGKTLYILDEPTTGLHFEDVSKLLQVLIRLVDAGNSIIVIEHNLEVVKCADYIIDLGPDGGDKGGELVAVGTPEEVAKNKKSYTGHFLKELL
ncbi:MAG: excinuclease ABC subunit UvrA [bacterium]